MCENQVQIRKIDGGMAVLWLAQLVGRYVPASDWPNSQREGPGDRLDSF